MNANDWGLLFDEMLLLVIAIFLTVKGLVLRRRTMVGRALARNNFAFAVAYYGAFFGTTMGWAFFRSDVWRWSARSLIALTLLHAIWSLNAYYGGWRGLLEELRLTGLEFWATWGEWAGMARWRVQRLWSHLFG